MDSDMDSDWSLPNWNPPDEMQQFDETNLSGEMSRFDAMIRCWSPGKNQDLHLDEYTERVAAYFQDMDAIRITVNDDAGCTHWDLSKRLLCLQSSYFRLRLTGPEPTSSAWMLAGKIKVLHLYHFDRSVFALFVQWLLGGCYADKECRINWNGYLNEEGSESRWSAKGCICAWILGYQLGATKFRNHAMARVYKEYHGGCPPEGSVQVAQARWMLKHAAGTTGLRSFVLDMILNIMKGYIMQGCALKELIQWESLFRGNYDLARNYRAVAERWEEDEFWGRDKPRAQARLEYYLDDGMRVGYGLRTIYAGDVAFAIFQERVDFAYAASGIQPLRSALTRPQDAAYALYYSGIALG